MGNEGTVITIVQDHTLKDLKKIAAQLDVTLQEVFLHGGALHTERPEVESEPKKSRVCRKIPEKLLKNYTLCQRKRRKAKTKR